ncbi:hypothetical protein RSAG8_05587, partial [Rhizoctonia solani AG-8 WAC10335]
MQATASACLMLCSACYRRCRLDTSTRGLERSDLSPLARSREDRRVRGEQMRRSSCNYLVRNYFMGGDLRTPTLVVSQTIYLWWRDSRAGLTPCPITADRGSDFTAPKRPSGKQFSYRCITGNLDSQSRSVHVSWT